MTRRAAPATAVRALSDLGELRAALIERERAAREVAEQARRQQWREQAQRQVFAREVGPVQALPARQRLHRPAAAAPPRPAPEPLQRLRDEQAVMREALSDEVDIESLLLSDDGLSFRKPGVAADVAARLRRGQWALQDQIDLHGHTRDEAREALGAFMRRAAQRGLRCVRVVHGKGLGSPGREPVLKGRVQRWLAQRAEVIAFAQASGPQGGAGALIVLLAPS